MGSHAFVIPDVAPTRRPLTAWRQCVLAPVVQYTHFAPRCVQTRRSRRLTRVHIALARAQRLLGTRRCVHAQGSLSANAFACVRRARMTALRCRTRAAAFLLAVLCVARAGDCTGDEARLRLEAALSGRAALSRCAPVRPTLGLRRVSSCQKGHGWAQMRGGRGAEARLRGRMSPRSHSHAGRPEALAPGRGSHLSSLREQSGADAATAADPWVWECERCERCAPVRVAEAVAPPAHAEPVHPRCASCKGCTHSLEMLNLTARACLA